MNSAQLLEFIGNHALLVTLFGALVVALIGNEAYRWSTAMPRVAAHEATRMINRDDALVLDVREQGEFRKGHIIGAKNVPEGELDDEAARIKKRKARPVIVCCGTGTAAPRAAERLSRAGIEQVYALRGGMTAWRDAQMPVTKE